MNKDVSKKEKRRNDSHSEFQRTENAEAERTNCRHLPESK